MTSCAATANQTSTLLPKDHSTTFLGLKVNYHLMLIDIAQNVQVYLCISSNVFVHSIIYYSHFLPQHYTPWHCVHILLYYCTTSHRGLAYLLYPQDLQLIAFPNSISNSFLACACICLHIQPQMLPDVGMAYPERLWRQRISTWVVEHGMVPLLVPEVFPPVDFSMQAHVFIRRHLALSQHLYCFVDNVFTSLVHIRTIWFLLFFPQSCLSFHDTLWVNVHMC